MIALSIAITVWALVALRTAELYFSNQRYLTRPASEARLDALTKDVDNLRTALNVAAAKAMSRVK